LNDSFLLLIEAGCCKAPSGIGGENSRSLDVQAQGKGVQSAYPEFIAEERDEAEVNLRRYLTVLLRMSERLANEGRSINDLVDCRLADSRHQMYHPHRPKVEPHQNN